MFARWAERLFSATPLARGCRPMTVGTACLVRIAAAALASALLGACASAPTPAPITWESRLDRGHPLAGRIWDVSAGAFVDESTLIAQVRAVAYVAVGEQHDNSDQHRPAARLVDGIAGAGRQP